MEYTGIVREGERRGATLGYPTINIETPLRGADGVYAARVRIEGAEYQAAAFANPVRGVLEAHLLGFVGDVYGQKATIMLKKKIRDAEEFHSDSALRAAIAEDVNAVSQFFGDAT